VPLDHFAEIFGSALTDNRIAVREGEAGKSGGGNEIPPTYVPLHKGHFLAVALS
jgi:7-cyano-7-deazaguanine synthase in queuosine biosynthesis